MTERISKELFKQIMAPLGYVFDENDSYICKDGRIDLRNDQLFCSNKVLYDDSRIYVLIQYPYVTDDLEEMSIKFDHDLSYHLSYQIYKDFMNKDTYDYKSPFVTEVFEYYTTVDNQT